MSDPASEPGGATDDEVAINASSPAQPHGEAQRSARPSPARRFVARLLRLAVAVALLAFVLTQADLPAIGSYLAGTAWGLYLLGVALLIVAQGLLVVNLLGAVRLIGGRLTGKPALRAHAAGLAANLVLPSSVGGDAVKTVLVRRAMPGYLDAAAAVVLARLAGMPGMLLNGAVGIAWTWPALHAAQLAVPAALIVGGLLLGLAVAWLVRHPLSRLLRRRFPRRFREPILRLLDALESISLRDLAPLLLLGWLYSVCGILWYALFAHALGLELSLIEVATAIILVYLLILLPISIQGIGVREAGYVMLFGAFGLAVEPAVAFSLLAFTAVLISSAMAILFLTLTGEGS